MFLKSLEIRGFKSFADKTEISFNKGITSVVGPNGSGKSNISDAVRWVLGEQSIKTLRGGKMEDVIFAGTQYRKPVGLAQVSLTLDNSDNKLPIDYSYVTISRRLYRSGESEYYINNSKCRLKDVQELFMDTGIGKEGYSIIGQGKIDAILSGKPEDRRKLLEEAAGIVKFKTRKEEAEKKLENTEQNLTRIQDILNTYEERIGPLEIEKNKAKEFLKFSEKLKLKEINIIVHNIRDLEEKLNEVKKSIDEINHTLCLNREDKEFLNKERNSYLNELQELENNLEEQKKTYYNKQSDHKDALGEINILNERINNLKVIINKNSLQLQEFTNKLKTFKMDKDLKEQNLQISQKDQLQLNNKISELENKLLNINSQISQDEDLLNKLKNNQMDIVGEITEFKNKKIILANEIEEMTKKLLDIENACEGYNNSIKINLNTKKMLALEKQNVFQKIQNYNEEIKQTKQELSKLNIDQNNLEKQLKIYNKQYNTCEANKNILINLEKQYEGYNKTVKLLMNNIDKGSLNIDKNHCHVLGEVIDVKKDLETAIEIALGASISNIITSNDHIAKNLIEYLKVNKLGRATFLPLNIIKGKRVELNSEIRNLDGYIGIASELIKYDNMFKDVIEYVLGKTIVAENLDFALKIAKLMNYKFRIVTLDGEVINPGGALTGGSVYHKNTSIISRKREIEELDEEIEKLDKTIEVTTKNIENHRKTIKDLDDKCLNLRDEIHYENIEITKIEGKINAIEVETEKLTKNLNVSNEEIQGLNEKLVNKDKEIKLCIENIDDYKEKENSNQIKINELEYKLKDKLKFIEQYRESLTELKVKKAQLDEVVNSKINELNRIDNDIEGINKSVKALEEEIEQSKINYGYSEEKIVDNKEKIKDILSYLEKMEKEFEEKDIEKIKIKEKIQENKQKVEAIDLVISNEEKDIHKHQLTFTKYETEKEGMYLKLNEEFQLTYAEALEYAEDVIDKNKLKMEITTLKEAISNLGVVNLGAIEEYEDIKSKFEFMNGQKEDLINAKEELMNVINDMTGNMRALFNENFTKLRTYFRETFRELFKGGNADLILGEGDELSCNIEINVEPPGKKLQNINLMSGGEKVLSAIALLFAILKMKPTPFCILDEIEAALDDANVIRYAEFLKAFSNNVQFIVITHRKGTMEASDVMYGVTMQEKGISKVVSIKLNN